MIANLLRRWQEWRDGCHHDWRNTGLSYTDDTHGFTVILRQCSLCNTTIIIEV